MFVCGPEVWAQSVRSAAIAAGVPDSQFHVEASDGEAMKKIMYFVMSTVTILVLLFGYRTSLMGPMNASDTVISSGDSSTSAAAAQTYTGTATQTEWGIVQVEITVADSRITDVQVLQYPNENPKDVRSTTTRCPC